MLKRNKSSAFKDKGELVAFVQKSTNEIVEGTVSNLNTGTPTVHTNKKRDSITVLVTSDAIKIKTATPGRTFAKLFDRKGRELTALAADTKDGWVVLPKVHYKGLAVLRVKCGNGSFMEKVLNLNN